VYGKGHVYASPFTGSGLESDLATITCDDVGGYYAKYLTPQSTTLVVVGSCETAELKTRLEQTFGQWPAVPAAVLPNGALQPVTDDVSVLIVNHQSPSQTVLAAGLATVARNS